MLSQKQIQNEVEKAKHKLIDASNYKNLTSLIEVECEKGHKYVTSVENLRKSPICPECTREIVSVSSKPPKKKGFRIVSIDQATNVAGISIFDDGNLVYVSDRKFYGDLNTRYANFATFLAFEVINQWEPDHIVFEDIQFQNSVPTFKTLAGLLGICIVLAETNKVPHTEIFNMTWQSKFNIKGRDRRSQKSNTIKKVKELFNLDVSDDMADSILMGYYYVLEKGVRLF